MLIEIKSNDNGRVKLVRKLHSKKGRSEEGKFVAEGINLVRELFERGLKADFVMSSKSVFEDEASEAHAILRELAASDDSVICVLDDRDFEKISDAEHGIDVLAVVTMPGRDVNPKELIGKGSNVLVLDRIQDPGNLGTMVRTAEAAGAAGIILSRECADLYSAKTVRATMSAIFRMPILTDADLREEIRALRENRVRIYAACLDDRARPYDRFDYTKDSGSGSAFLVGNEGNGLREETIRLSDETVYLPMAGQIESLNAAVAASILLYEAARQRHFSGRE